MGNAEQAPAPVPITAPAGVVVGSHRLVRAERTLASGADGMGSCSLQSPCRCSYSGASAAIRYGLKVYPLLTPVVSC